MTNRRQILQIGITATAWPLASRAAQAAGRNVSGRGAVQLYKVIYDKRFEDSVSFARRAAALGLPLEAIEGDMTRFWYDDLYHVWKQDPVAIAGLTAHGPMFCFEQIGRDQGMRIVFSAEHRFGAGVVEHEFSGPLAMLSHGMAVESKPGWSACMADVIAECPGGRTEISTAHAVTAVPRPAVAPDAASLFSWVIAPAVKV